MHMGMHTNIHTFEFLKASRPTNITTRKITMKRRNYPLENDEPTRVLIYNFEGDRVQKERQVQDD